MNREDMAGAVFALDKSPDLPGAIARMATFMIFDQQLPAFGEALFRSWWKRERRVCEAFLRLYPAVVSLPAKPRDRLTGLHFVRHAFTSRTLAARAFYGSLSVNHRHTLGAGGRQVSPEAWVLWCATDAGWREQKAEYARFVRTARRALSMIREVREIRIRVNALVSALMPGYVFDVDRSYKARVAGLLDLECPGTLSVRELKILAANGWEGSLSGGHGAVLLDDPDLHWLLGHSRYGRMWADFDKGISPLFDEAQVPNADPEKLMPGIAEAIAYQSAQANSLKK